MGQRELTFSGSVADQAIFDGGCIVSTSGLVQVLPSVDSDGFLQFHLSFLHPIMNDFEKCIAGSFTQMIYDRLLLKVKQYSYLMESIMDFMTIKWCWKGQGSGRDSNPVTNYFTSIHIISGADTCQSLIVGILH